MPTLKKEMFLRPTRFNHRFGERDDPLMPLSQQTFELPYPNLSKLSKSSKGANIKTNGLEVFIEPFSGVSKPRGGHASLSGPQPDRPDSVGNVVPASTEMRRSNGPIYESEKSALNKGKKRG